MNRPKTMMDLLNDAESQIDYQENLLEKYRKVVAKLTVMLDQANEHISFQKSVVQSLEIVINSLCDDLDEVDADKIRYIELYKEQVSEIIGLRNKLDKIPYQLRRSFGAL